MADHSAAREHLMDAVKASPLVGYVLAIFNGVDWGLVGAFWMAIYAFLLVLDKLGLLAPLKRAVWRLFHHGPPSA